MVYTQPRIRPRKWDAHSFLGFWNTNGSSNVDQTTRPTDCQQKKENVPNCGLCRSGWSQGKLKKKANKYKYLALARELEKSMEHESNGDANCNWGIRYSHQRIGTRTGGIGNKRISGGYANYSIVEIGHNTKKSPKDMRRLAVTQSPEESHQLMLETIKNIKLENVRPWWKTWFLV